VLDAEQRRISQRDPRSFDAWELALHGCWHLERGTQSDNSLAQQLFTRAVGIDPRFVLPHVGMAMSHYAELVHQWMRFQNGLERVGLS